MTNLVFRFFVSCSVLLFTFFISSFSLGGAQADRALRRALLGMLHLGLNLPYSIHCAEVRVRHLR